MSGFVAGQSLPAADLNAALVVKRVRVATTVAGTLASSFENGDTVDGVVLATGDRILIKDQAAGAANGIYVVAASGSPTRAVDFDSSAEVLTSTVVMVSEGTVNADSAWMLTTNAPITLDTTALVFTRFGAVGDLLDIQWARKTSDQSVTSSTTLVNCTQLVQAIGANEVWEFDFDLWVQGASTGDIQIAFTVPTSCTLKWASVGGPTTAMSSASSVTAINPYQTTTSGGRNDFGALSDIVLLKLKVFVRNSTNAGNVQLQFAQSASDVGATWVLTDSTMTARRWV